MFHILRNNALVSFEALPHASSIKVPQFQCEALKYPSVGLHLQVLNDHKVELTQEL